MPGPGENLFLSVRLFDAATGEKVPYATIRARVGGEGAPAARPLRPLFGAKGFQYGGNFAAPPGDLEVSLEVEPPPLGRVHPPHVRTCMNFLLLIILIVAWVMYRAIDRLTDVSR